MKIKNYGLRRMIIAFMVAGFAAMSFGYANDLYFSPDTLSVHLYCNTQTTSLMVSGVAYNAFTYDLINATHVTLGGGTVLSPFGGTTTTVACGSDSCYSLTYYIPGGADTAGIHTAGNITVGNSGFLRTGVTNMYTSNLGGASAIVKNASISENILQTTGTLITSYYLGPCTPDSKNPLLTFTGMTPHSGAAYYGPQYNDRVYQFNLHDDDPSEVTSRGFSHGSGDTWSPDWDGGSGYVNGILVSSGINLSTFVFQIAVESGHTIPQQWRSVTITGVMNFTGSGPFTGFRDGVLSNGVVFHPYNFVWNRWNRDYYSVISTGDVWPGPSFIDDSNNVVFGDDYEEEVQMTGYVYDRVGRLSNLFSVAFNQGVNPWSSYIPGSGAYVGCGPAGTTGMAINIAPATNSGAYVERVNSGFYLKPFKVYLHDDWAGINSGKVVVKISGTQNNTPVIIVLTGNQNPGTLTLSGFAWNGFVKPCLGRACPSVTSVVGSTRNYAVTVNYTGIFDPETSISVAIDYEDMVGRTGYTVSCSNSYNNTPWATIHEFGALNSPTNCGPGGSSSIGVNTAPATDSGAYIQKYNSGFYLRPFTVYAQDDWMGVSGGSLKLTVNRVEYNGSSLISHAKTFSGTDIATWIHKYSIPVTGGPNGHMLSGLQDYNYRIDVPDSAIYFSGYLAPESTVTVSLAYTDLGGRAGTVMSCTTGSQQQPWAQNISAGTYASRITGCGPSNAQTIQVNTAPADSGAYLTKWNKGFYLEPFRVYLQDEWVGVDQSSIQLVISGSVLTAGGALSGVTLTFDGPTLEGHNRLKQYSLAPGYVGGGGTPLLDAQKYNYYIDMPQSTQYLSGYFAPETKIEVFVNYKDFYGNLLSQHSGDQVSCNYFAGLIPFVKNPSWTSDLHIYRYPYPQGGILTGFSISLEDEWAGINSGTIALRIQGQKLSGPTHTLTPVDELFTGGRLADLGRIHPYAVSGSSLGLMEDQAYNYTITLPDSYSSYLSGDFFAPEWDITVSIESYSDFALRSGTLASQMVNQAASPFVTPFGSTMDPLSTRDSAFPISTYGIPTTGFKFGVFDHWAGVNSGYNLVKVQGTRRGQTTTYLFAATGSSITSSGVWTQCGPLSGNNCLATNMTQAVAQITGTDAFQLTHPTVERSTGYFYQVAGHDIYFDYTSDLLSSSPYTVSVYAEDLKPTSPNQLVSSHTSYISSGYACVPIARCSYQELTFVRGPDIFAYPNYTATQDPLIPQTGTTNNPFMGTRVNVIGSGVTLNTGANIIDCASGGVLGTNITLSFTGVTQLGGTPAVTGSTSPYLNIADGWFELTGVNMDVLIVK